MKQTMKPNQLQQATQELSSLNLGSFSIPSNISTKEKGYYVCVGVKARQSKDGMSTLYEAKTLYAMPSLWQEMEREAKSGRVKGMFLGIFNKIVILHNPTLPMAKEEKPKDKKIKGLSPTHKSKVNAMMEEGKGQDDEGLKAIAEELGITFERVKAYIQSF